MGLIWPSHYFYGYNLHPLKTSSLETFNGYCNIFGNHEQIFSGFQKFFTDGSGNAFYHIPGW